MPHDLPKAYEPGAIEPRWAEYWVHEKLFHVELPSDPGQPTFTVTLPPPNVTGNLHMGHMLEHTEIDIIVRWKRMQGLRTLWLPGTDHAGIATQLMVERQLAAEGKNRRDLGREAFIARVWDWKQHYGGVILQQMKRLGASVDWSREYFTMDERMSRAVREAFVRLHEEGLIYRGKYIVNWCPRCVTAVSDLEVVHEDTPGKIYEIRYPVVGSTNEYIVVATTRPETMLGDTAVAVNSADERYRHLHGKKVLLPLMNREIPIITDDILANPEFGTGAVKVTPSHDPNDFEAGLRNNLPQIDVMNEVAQMNQNAGPYQGLDRFEARQKVLEDLEQGGFLVGVEGLRCPAGQMRSLQDHRRATAFDAVVRQDPAAGRPRHRGGGERRRQVRAGELLQDLFRVDAQHSRLVHLAAIVVGTSHSRRGIAKIAAKSWSRGKRPPNAPSAAEAIWSKTTTCSTPGSRRACCRARRWVGPTARPTSTPSTRRRC